MASLKLAAPVISAHEPQCASTFAKHPLVLGGSITVKYKWKYMDEGQIYETHQKRNILNVLQLENGTSSVKAVERSEFAFSPVLFRYK